MSVAHAMGLEDEASELLCLAGQRWGGWVSAESALAVVDGVRDLRCWLRSAGPAEADQVLLALAALGAVDGGDDVAAAATLAWSLLPGASVLANRLRTLSPEIDSVVAAQLWTETRTFPWRRLGKVAANILCNTRAGVLRECGVTSQLERVDRTWSRTTPLDPSGAFWSGQASNPAESPATAADELLEVLDWACEVDVITDDDRVLLLCLVEAADREATVRVGRGQGGLMANEVSAAVARAWGISPATVRRRARRSMTALASACVRPDERLSA